MCFIESFLNFTLKKISHTTYSAVTSQCVISELISLGRELSGAVFIAKRFLLRSCGHAKKGVSATECVQSLVGKYL